MSFRIVTASSNFLKWTCSVCLQGLLLLLSNECLKNYNDGVFFARKKNSTTKYEFEKQASAKICAIDTDFPLRLCAKSTGRYRFIHHPKETWKYGID